MIYRWVVAIFFVLSVIYSIKSNIDLGAIDVYFIYWTHLNLWGTMVTMTLGAVLVTKYFFSQDKIGIIMPRSLRFFWAMWNQSIVFACLISGSYWILLHKTSINMDIIFTHAFNVIVPVVDLFVIAHPPRYSQFFYVTFVGVSYGVFTIVYQFSGGLDK